MFKGMKKMCELCSHPASMYCHSDQASLCYDCDRKVHSHNFLVAKHSRNLLCHICQSPTSWIASGGNLDRAASFCASCVDGKLARGRHQINRSGNAVVEENRFVYDDLDGEEVDGETDEDDGEYSDSDDDEEDGEQQLVLSSPVPSPPAAAASLASVEVSASDFSSECFDSSKKRKRQEATNPETEDDKGCSSAKRNGKARTETSTRSFRTLKAIRSENHNKT